MGHGKSEHSCTHRQSRIMARYRSNVFSEGPGRQKGLFRARYSRNVFPKTVFHCFSPLKTYIRSLCCQQHAVRACISATYCHEETFLPSGPPPGIHDNRFLPLFNAQPFHAGHSGGAPGEWPTSDEGRAPGEDPALTAKVFPTGGSPGGNRASPIGEPRYLIGGILRSASALAFLLRSPFRSQLRQALHWARNR